MTYTTDQRVCAAGRKARTAALPAAGQAARPVLSSQVQCANALTRMVADPGRVARAFGGVADRVRVVGVLRPANAAYQESLPRPEHRAPGSTVSRVWSRLLRRPERFTTMDPEAVGLEPLA